MVRFVRLQSTRQFPNQAKRPMSLNRRSFIMLYWSLMFLLIALVAGVLGFTGIYVAAAGIAKVLFFIFLVLFVISLLRSGLSGRGV
jgi:uncharacterized membrane protein YtjA (UPF0391 family)